MVAAGEKRRNSEADEPPAKRSAADHEKEEKVVNDSPTPAKDQSEEGSPVVDPNAKEIKNDEVKDEETSKGESQSEVNPKDKEGTSTPDKHTQSDPKEVSDSDQKQEKEPNDNVKQGTDDTNEGQKSGITEKEQLQAETGKQEKSNVEGIPKESKDSTTTSEFKEEKKPAKTTGFGAFKDSSKGGFGAFSSGGFSMFSKDSGFSKAKENEKKPERDTLQKEPEEQGSKEKSQLQERQEVKTGEEEEKTDLSLRVRLYAVSLEDQASGWKERGVGQLKLNSNNEGKHRLLMRADGNLRVALNLALSSATQVYLGFPTSLSSEKVVRLTGVDNDGTTCQFAMRCASAEAAKELYDVLKNVTD